LKVPCIRWNLLGSAFRIGGNAIVGGYGLFYFNVYNKANLFSLYQMGVFFVGGFFSPIFYAHLCDKFEHKNLKIKAQLAAL